MSNKDAQLKLGKIGLVAGNGNFPILLIEDMIKNGTPFAVSGIRGFVSPKVKEIVGEENYVEGNIADFNTCSKFFKSKNVDTVIMIGGVDRRKFKLKHILNWTFLKFILKVLTYKQKHDGVFRVIISTFEKAGFKFVGVQDAMPSLMSKVGLLTKTEPSEQDKKDIEIAIVESKKLGMTDTGQAVVVKDEKLLGVETVSGTDTLINSSLLAKNNEQGGVMAKLTKPGQEERGDIPAIGFWTLENLIKGKLNGIVVEGEYKTIFENKEELIKEFDKNNIFLLVIE